MKGQTVNEVQIIGMDQLNRMLRDLPAQVSYKLQVNALRRAAKPIQDAAKGNAPVRKDVTRKAIQTRSQRETEPVVYVGVTHGKHQRFDAWYAKFQEFGTGGFGKRRRRLTRVELNTSAMKKGYIRKSYKTMGYGKKGAGLPARHFMTNAFNNKKDEALQSVNKELSFVVSRYLKRTSPNVTRGNI